MSDEFIFDSDDFVTFCSEFDNIPVCELTDSLLEVNLQDLHDRWTNVQKSYRGICVKADDAITKEFIESARGKYAACTRSFHKCKSKILDLQKTLVTPASALVGNLREEASGCIKLPPCDTEIFYGGYEEWPSFRDMFTAVYVDHPKLSAVQKLYHLRLKVQGKAAGIVRKYKLCGENFSLAWESLKSRYENKRVLVDNQLRILLNLDSIACESSESLQRIQTSINDCLAALRAQDISTADWDPILVYLCSTKLPHETLSLWEQSLKSHKDLPKWADMDTFLSNRYEVVERLDSIQGRTAEPKKSFVSDAGAFKPDGTTQYLCKLCNDKHSLKNCHQFLELSPAERNQFVSQNKICLNCLGYNHLRKNCKSKFVCAQCKRNHHSLLHFSNEQSVRNASAVNVNTNIASSQEEPRDTSAQVRNSQVLHSMSHFNSAQAQNADEKTILPTAIVTVLHQGDTFSARAFFDQGSEKSFISKRLQQRLGLPVDSRQFQIRGMGGQVVANSTSLCKLTLFSESHDRTINLSAIVVPKITRLLPSFVVPRQELSLDDTVEMHLADPEFHSPGPVDLLLGSNVIPKLILDGVREVCDSLLAQATIFGWVISGPITLEAVSAFSLQATELSNDVISQQLKQFWEQEEVPGTRPISSEDEYCENLFHETTRRGADGRYIVRLPFKPNFHENLPLGSSRAQALIQYVRMEQTLKRKPEIEKTYNEVLREYESLDHMELTTSQETSEKGSFNSFYLPHHAVVRPESRSTKVRVVFNASKRTSTGNSLNDVLCVGPTLQLDLTTVIIRWRLYQYVFCGDIEKMYRQILVHKDDTCYQKILFRPSPTSPIKDYALKTVTFGVNCAPYLAIRTLNRLATDSQETFPRAARIIKTETYVDDILSGGHDIQSAVLSLTQLTEMLKTAGFPLKKITSNTAEILKSVPEEGILDTQFLKFYETSGTKTLGIQWNALHDCFSYKIEAPELTLKVTKREMLSDASRLFDPAGWIAPIVIRAKIILQELWLEGTKWDEPVSRGALIKWNHFVSDLTQIGEIRIPRWVNFAPQHTVQIHGFCDASEKAYCATVYIRIEANGVVYSHLIVAKTKVAPIDPVSLPRLELCGAVLLSQLVSQLRSSLPIQHFRLVLWSDSSIVLGWLKKPPCTWKTYVANRTAKIFRNVGNISWRHVGSNDNPADIGSRGCSPEELKSNLLWWHGPKWLEKPSTEWPQQNVAIEVLPETRKIEVFHTIDEEDDILCRFSRWDRAIRVIAYVFRFINSALGKLKAPKSLNISQTEFIHAKNRLILLSQQTFYFREYESLTKSKAVHRKSPLFPLNPFLDSCGLIRVNGRIANSTLKFDESHPVVLSVHARFSTLFISFIHEFLLHAEINLMMRTIREEYYISRLRSAIRKCIRGCKTCIVYKQKMQSQIMAALPLERCSFSLPFCYTGLDFAGPFSIKTSMLRQAIYQKGYVCVFVCFSTKAVHLELCSDLSSGAFLAAFARFVGRRGLPQKIMSDNGTNFVGAERILRHEFSEFLKTASEDLSNKYVAHGLKWSFIPPNAPHMGGLWEAGVKSFKHHFKKVTQGQKYTFEEFATLLARIEAVLNSRPLSPMSDDPQELLALTPGHFLRGAPLVTLPEGPPENLSFIDRWEKLKALQHQFARRWKDEYLKELHRRYRWQSPKEDVKVGQMVVVKDDLLPPCDWRLGRIKKVYQGQGGFVRVADVRTSSGVITRAITKLCLLPTDIPVPIDQNIPSH